MKRVVIIGGGVIGLSWAYELSSRGHQVTLLEKNLVGRKSSWAGAGILQPSNLATALHPIEQLEALSTQLHIQWSRRLLDSTNIDNGFWECGGLYLARSAGENAALAGQQADWAQRAIPVEPLTMPAAKVRFPRLRMDAARRILFLPGEAQVRNPHHLQALQTACLQQDVTILDGLLSVDLIGEKNRIKRVEIRSAKTGTAVIAGDEYGIAAGAWTENLLAPLGLQIPVTPVRGQMVLFKLPGPMGLPIVYEGSRYLVPRKDGHVLAGATVEEVGFDETTQASDIDSLVHWANSLCDDLNRQSQVSQWAGLRPGSFDGFPYLGQLAGLANAWIATGHFKTGLHLSTATAVVMSDLIEGTIPPIDLQPFCPARANIHRCHGSGGGLKLTP